MLAQGLQRSVNDVLELRIRLADDGADWQFTLRVSDGERAKPGLFLRNGPQTTDSTITASTSLLTSAAKSSSDFRLDLAVPATLVGQLVTERHRLHADELARQPFDRCHSADSRRDNDLGHEVVGRVKSSRGLSSAYWPVTGNTIKRSQWLS